MEWISVAHGKPEASEAVLCYGICNGCKGIFFGYQDFRGNWWEYNNGDYIDGGYGADYQANVTHWMSILPPPSA